MSENGRNFLVGIFVLVGLAVLGLLIVKFQTTVEYFRGRGDYYIEIKAETTADVRVGQNVHLNGKSIGQVSSVELAEDPRQGVIITAAINQKYGIPEDVKVAHIYQGQIGPPYIEIKADDSHSAVMMKKTPGQVTASLKAEAVGPFSRLSAMAEKLGPEMNKLGPALEQIGKLAENLNTMLAGPGPGEGAPGEGTDGERLDLQGLVKEFSAALSNLNALIGDEKDRENFKQGLANLRQAGQDASEALGELKSFASQAKETTSEVGMDVRTAAQGIIKNSAELSALLGQLNKAAAKVNEGQGTAGKMLYDPALYEEMLSVSKQLDDAVLLLRSLLKKWNQEGVNLKW